MITPVEVLTISARASAAPQVVAVIETPLPDVPEIPAEFVNPPVIDPKARVAPFEPPAIVPLFENAPLNVPNSKCSALNALSIEVARTFLGHLAKNYTATKQSRQLNSATMIREVAKVFSDGKKTLLDLAKVVDDNFKFPDE